MPIFVKNSGFEIDAEMYTIGMEETIIDGKPYITVNGFLTEVPENTWIVTYSDGSKSLIPGHMFISLDLVPKEL